MRTSAWWLLVPVAIIGFLTTLQIRWLNQLHHAEAVRREQWLQRTTFLIASEVNHLWEDLRNIMADGTDEPRSLVKRWRRWQEQALDPRLVEAIWLVASPHEGALRLGPEHDFIDQDLPPSLKSWLVRGQGPGIPPLVVGSHGEEKTPVVVLQIDEKRFLSATFGQIAALGAPDVSRFHLRLLHAQTGGVLLGPEQFTADGSAHVLLPRFFRSPFVLQGNEVSWSNPLAANGAQSFHFDSHGALRLETRLAAGTLDQLRQRDLRQNGMLAGSAWLLLTGTLIAMAVYLNKARQLANQQALMMATFSHELRTPLTTLTTAGENLSGAADLNPDRVKVYGTLITQESQRLRTMVNQILSYVANANAKDLADAKHASDAVEALAKVERELAMLFAEKRCTLVAVTEADATEVAMSRDFLETVLHNLLSNALKFGPAERKIEVKLQSQLYRGKRGLSIQIKDHGYGIKAEEARKIFRRFYRGKLAREAQIQGIGLGLSLVKRLVVRSKGWVACRNHPVAGCVFTVWLPTPGKVK